MSIVTHYKFTVVGSVSGVSSFFTRHRPVCSSVNSAFCSVVLQWAA